MGLADTVRAAAGAVASNTGSSGGGGGGGSPGSTNIGDAIRAIGAAVASPAAGHGRGSPNVADVVAAGVFALRVMGVERAVADLEAAITSVRLRDVLAHDARARFLLSNLMKRMAALTSEINRQLGR